MASAYVAIGVFASSLTENQIVAFLLALLLCFTFYIGFDYLADLPLFQQIQTQIYSIGMNEHYRSISRGIIDSRDLIYFLSLTAGFILMTQTVLKSRKW
jgi:ABC-2 type transport system permease protein